MNILIHRALAVTDIFKMKSCWPVVLIFFLGCKAKHNSFPTFEPNMPVDKVWNPVQSIAKENKFCIACLESGGAMAEPSSLSNKFLCFSYNDGWKKIEFRRGIRETDMAVASSDIITKDVTLHQECSNVEGERIISQLVKLNFFQMKSGAELLKQCQNTRENRLTKISDGAGVTFFIIGLEGAREMHFEDVFERAKECPQMQEWDDIISVKKLFDDNWFTKDDWNKALH
jgi:hypothetical protein